MRTRSCSAAAVLLTTLALAACGGSKPNPTDPGYVGNLGPGGPSDPGSVFGDAGLSFGTAKTRHDANDGGGGGLGVNAYLWRGALDTLGFMPLASADPFGGVIITDWYTPAGSTGERFKATAYILGQWVDAPVSPVTVGEIEDKVLARARQLREQSAGS